MLAKYMYMQRKPNFYSYKRNMKKKKRLYEKKAHKNLLINDFAKFYQCSI